MDQQKHKYKAKMKGRSIDQILKPKQAKIEHIPCYYQRDHSDAENTVQNKPFLMNQVDQEYQREYIPLFQSDNANPLNLLRSNPFFISEDYEEQQKTIPLLGFNERVNLDAENTVQMKPSYIKKDDQEKQKTIPQSPYEKTDNADAQNREKKNLSYFIRKLYSENQKKIFIKLPKEPLTGRIVKELFIFGGILLILWWIFIK